MAALVAIGCGARSGLLIPQRDVADAAPDAAASCVAFPPIPAAAPASACTFDATGPATPVLAAIAGDDLVALTAQGAFTKLFHFDPASAAGQYRIVTSRGAYLGALRAGIPAAGQLDVEWVLVRLDGTVIAHDREQFTAQSFGGAAGVVGNAGGTFAFGAGMGDLGKVWVAVDNGSGAVLGPFDGSVLPNGGLYSPRVEPDARGRFTVLPVASNSSAAVDWLDPCTGVHPPALLPAQGDAVGFVRELFGASRTGQLSTETADGVTPVAHASLGSQFELWDFVAPHAMFDVPPFSSGLGTSASLLVVDARTLADRHLTLAYPGLTVVPTNAWLSAVGDSNNPVGFGLDSAGDVTMFLSDASGAIHLETTADGGTWTPIGAPVTFDPVFAPSESLAFAEADGTYVLQGVAPGSGKQWQVVRPAAGVLVKIAGPGRIAFDGRCVAALVSATELDIVNATTGTRTAFALPAAADPQSFASTWIGGDDAVLPGP